MTRFDDKREHERFDLNASMVYAFHDSDLFYQARMCNYCKGGMCFKSSLFLRPGATLSIRVKEFQSFSSQKGNGDDLRCMSLAEVKWCNELPGAEAAAYSVGVKYQPPAY